MGVSRGARAGHDAHAQAPHGRSQAGGRGVAGPRRPGGGRTGRADALEADRQPAPHRRNAPRRHPLRHRPALEGALRPLPRPGFWGCHRGKAAALDRPAAADGAQCGRPKPDHSRLRCPERDVVFDARGGVRREHRHARRHLAARAGDPPRPRPVGEGGGAGREPVWRGRVAAAHGRQCRSAWQPREADRLGGSRLGQAVCRFARRAVGLAGSSPGGRRPAEDGRSLGGAARPARGRRCQGGGRCALRSEDPDDRRRPRRMCKGGRWVGGAPSGPGVESRPSGDARGAGDRGPGCAGAR